MNTGTYPGRVGADAELRTSQAGTPILNFRIANDTGFGDRKKSQWIDCSYFGKGAQAISDMIKKGDKVTVFGEITLDEFTRRDGTPGSKLALNVSHVELSPRASRDGGSSGGGGYDQSIGTDQRGSDRPPAGGGAQRGGGKPAFDQDLDDEIPF